MSVGLLLLTHKNVGRVLIDTAFQMLDAKPIEPAIIEVDLDSDIDLNVQQASALISNNSGTLILTDIYGSTPSNIASQLITRHTAYAVSGINIPMLIRVLNYPQLTLEQLAEKASSGGIDGVIMWNSDPVKSMKND